ncbi:MAG: AMP-binding protein, partial [Pseudomonadota bacterium]
MTDAIAIPTDDPVARFLAVSAAHPDAIAVESGDRPPTTYRAFAERVRRIAGAVLQARARTEGEAPPRVLIAMRHSEDAYAAMFATLMAGGQYAPLNSEAPVARRSAIARSFGPNVVLFDDRLDLETEGAATLSISAALGAEPLEAPRRVDAVSAVAYTMFTSGSTGAPKGVVVGRAGLADFVAQATPILRLGPGVRCAQHCNIAFDVSIVGIFGALTTGATLIPVTSVADRLMPGKAIGERKIDRWISVPSVVDLIAKAGHATPERLGGVTHFYFCGEALLPAHLDAIFAAAPDALVVNAYGPTEATVAVTEGLFTKADYRAACRTSAAIGPPLGGMRVDLVGGRTADEGEIVISGDQVAFGYWRDLARSAERFGTDAATGKRSFHTGDWAERIDGHVYFVARIDRQVKRHGHRIELGEIDAALRDALNGAAA